MRAKNLGRDERPSEAVAVRKDGSTFPAEFVGKEIGYRGHRRRVGIARDLTERRARERELRESRAALAAALDQQSLLFRELSHRVVNGFQAMASLLRWQRRGIKDEEAGRALELAAERIRAMALVHRRLYRGEGGFGAQDVAAYLQGLCDDLREAFVTGMTCHKR